MTDEIVGNSYTTYATDNHGAAVLFTMSLSGGRILCVFCYTYSASEPSLLVLSCHMVRWPSA